MRNFKQMRIDAGLKQTDVAHELNLTVQTIFSWERGRAPVARRHWSTLASLFRVSVEEMEAALVQTLLESCIEKGSTDALKNAVVSGLYRPELLQDAFARFNAPPPTPDKTREIELREEILRLREENVKLREEILRLREALAASNPDGDGSSTPFRYPSNARQSEEPKTTMR